MKGSGTQATKQRSKKRILSSRKVFLEQKKIWFQKSFLEKSEAREQAILGYLWSAFFFKFARESFEHSDSIIKCLGIAFSYVVAPKRAVCL